MQGDALCTGFERARRCNGILLGEAIEDRLWRDAEAGQLRRVEIDENGLLLGAIKIDLGDIRDPQERLLHRLGLVLELAIARALAGERS